MSAKSKLIAQEHVNEEPAFTPEVDTYSFGMVYWEIIVICIMGERAVPSNSNDETLTEETDAVVVFDVCRTKPVAQIHSLIQMQVEPLPVRFPSSNAADASAFSHCAPFYRTVSGVLSGAISQSTPTSSVPDGQLQKSEHSSRR